MGEKKNLNGLLPLYYKNVRHRSEFKGRKHILSICGKLGINYKKEGEEYFLAAKEYKQIQEIFNNRLLYEQNSISLYSTKEIMEILNISNSHVSKMVRNGSLNVKTLIGKKY